MAGLLLCMGIWTAWAWVQRAETVGGRTSAPSAAARTVQNIACIGACENVTVTSDQEPGRVYLENTAFDACIPVTLWANRVREDQIGVNGFLFHRGGQVNLRPITVDGSGGENMAVRMVMKDAAPTLKDENLPAVFSFTLRDQGDWNLIDSASFAAENGSGMSVNTEYASGVVTMYDGCSENARNLVTYALYQAPELVWEGSEQTYLVTIVRRGTYGESIEAQDVKVFERIYTQAELEASSILVEAIDDDVTLRFELVVGGE